MAALIMVFSSLIARAAVPFVTPKPEELAMTSVPEFPGAPAVVLYREEVTRDTVDSSANLNNGFQPSIPSRTQYYSRIKILTEAGKEYGSIEIRTRGGWTTAVDDVVGRTIHPDGTIIPFAGKPYFKVIERDSYGNSEQETVFTMPAVEVGSIIEYSYSTHQRSASYVTSPIWEIQGPLPIKLAHYEWRPRTGLEDNKGKAAGAVSWFPVLPAGAQVEHMKSGYDGVFISAKDISYDTYALTIHNVPSLPDEDYMPPLSLIRYGVHFAYVGITSASDNFWAAEGNSWSKDVDHFLKINGNIKKASEAMVAGATTQREKARKIYAAVMEMENTDYTRSREAKEDKAEGNGNPIQNVSDVLGRGRGTSSQLTLLFIALARAEGLEAYAMLVPDRSHETFTPQWLSMSQFDAKVAIVSLEGQEVFLDPGSRYCPFGSLAWKHTSVQGVRQGPKGSFIAKTPIENVSANSIGRVANLTMDSKGAVTGKVDIIYAGAQALQWREVGLRHDETELRERLAHSLEETLPATLKVKVNEIKDLTNYEQTLKVSATVSGMLGTSTGKRLVLPVDLFVAREAAVFSQSKRATPVYFHYPENVQDALKIILPGGTSVEAIPDASSLELANRAKYDLTVTSTPSSFTTRRHFAMATIYVPTGDYADLRAFYSQFEIKDHESVVLANTSKQVGIESATP